MFNGGFSFFELGSFSRFMFLTSVTVWACFELTEWE
jgi:hypothetical protein